MYKHLPHHTTVTIDSIVPTSHVNFQLWSQSKHHLSRDSHPCFSTRLPFGHHDSPLRSPLRISDILSYRRRRFLSCFIRPTGLHLKGRQTIQHPRPSVSNMTGPSAATCLDSLRRSRGPFGFDQGLHMCQNRSIIKTDDPHSSYLTDMCHDEALLCHDGFSAFFCWKSNRMLGLQASEIHPNGRIE